MNIGHIGGNMGQDLIESRFDEACNGLADASEILTAAQAVGYDLGKEILDDLAEVVPAAKAFLITGKWTYRLGKWIWLGSAPQLQRIVSALRVTIPTAKKGQDQIDHDTILENFRFSLSQMTNELDDQRLWWHVKALQASATPGKAQDRNRPSFFIAISQLSPGALRVYEYFFLTQALKGPEAIFDENSSRYILELRQQGLIVDNSSTAFAQNMWAFLLPENPRTKKNACDHFLAFANNDVTELNIQYLKEDVYT